jgi:hypothetical protein
MENWLVHGALADESTAVARNLLVLGLERQLVVIGDLFSKLDVVLSGNDDLSLAIDAHDRGLVCRARAECERMGGILVSKRGAETQRVTLFLASVISRACTPLE